MNYFNDSIAILTIGIGSLFSGIEVHRNDKGVFKVIKVPLMFAGKSHWYQKQFKNLVDVENISKVLPQMSFQLTNLQYDPDRQTNKFEKIKINQIESSPLYHFAKKWLQTRIPYIFTFTLSIQIFHRSQSNTRTSVTIFSGWRKKLTYKRNTYFRCT